MGTIPAPAKGEERILLGDVNWEAYEALLKTWANRPVRMTYDNGWLEIMSPLRSHEKYGALLRRMIEAYTEELAIPLESGGMTTFRRQAKQRGLEPDACYWIQNEQRMRGRKEFDAEVDPPPDLAIEVDITSSSLDRMSIYATLGVPEVWRFDSETLTINLLQADATYAPHARSRALPDLPPDEVMRFLRLSDKQDETSLIRSFRSWVRKQVRARRKPSTKKTRRSRRQ
jgi:Uma2 family endonuclease